MYFQRKPGKKVASRVYVYLHTDGKNKTLPRAVTKHLDTKADWEVEDWMRWYAAVHKLEHRMPFKVDIGGLEELVARFIKFLESQGKHRNTLLIYEARLLEVLPHFKDHLNYNDWYLVAGSLYGVLLKKQSLAGNPISANHHNRCNIAFRAFYRWLQEQGLVHHRHSLMLRNRPEPGRNTPLRFTLTPEQVHEFAAAPLSEEVRLMLLIGFFFSLRTDELFGLRKQDFIAGKQAAIFEAAKVMDKRSLCNKLVVNIRQCRRGSGVFYVPTSRKRGGVVACFNEDAAKLIIKLINNRPNDLLFDKHLPGHWSKVWGHHGIHNITLKDLRRASLYWLGHYSDLNFVDLQNHARHSQPSTTALYMRRPEEEFDGNEINVLDLDA